MLEMIGTLIRTRLPRDYVPHEAFEARIRYSSASSLLIRTNGRLGGILLLYRA